MKRLLLLAPPPELLVVHLKRFGGSTHAVKLGGHVDFPEVLDLAPYTACAARPCGAEAEAPPTPEPAPAPPLYRLAAVVVHAGSMAGGHYIAYARYGPPQPFAYARGAGSLLEPPCGALWAYASDNCVSDASLDVVLASEAYLLFYERVELKI